MCACVCVSSFLQLVQQPVTMDTNSDIATATTKKGIQEDLSLSVSNPTIPIFPKKDTLLVCYKPTTTLLLSLPSAKVTKALNIILQNLTNTNPSYFSLTHTKNKYGKKNLAGVICELHPSSKLKNTQTIRVYCRIHSKCVTCCTLYRKMDMVLNGQTSKKSFKVIFTLNIYQQTSKQTDEKKIDKAHRHTPSNTFYRLRRKENSTKNN